MNVERNAKLYELWKEGQTIRQAAPLAGVPEGTVAYYWNKFNRAAVAGRPIPIGAQTPEKELSETELADNAKIKNDVLKTTLQMVAEGKGEKIKYALEAVEKLQKLGLIHSPEDSIAAFNQILSEPKTGSFTTRNNPAPSPDKFVEFKTLRWTPPPLSDPFLDENEDQE